VKAGAAAYQQSCARCHGPAGKADGVDAKRFYPRPRDLSMGVYKFRTTVSGTPPTDEDLYRTVNHGLPGSNMPDWQHLDEATRWQLVYYLKSLSPIFEQTQPSPVAVTPDPGKRADLKKGRAVYEQLQCAACHGPQGRGNGPSASGLVDDWGQPIVPADLTQGWSYRGGSDPESIMYRFLAGIDGAGMPSYAEAISPEDAWHLAYYVTTLHEAPKWNMVARAHKVKGALPTSADDPVWEHAERTDAPLRNAVEPDGEWKHPPTVRAISFKAVYNEDSIAFKVWWDDPTQQTKQPADGMAFVFKPAGTDGDLVTLQAWPYSGAPVLDFCYWAADNGNAIEMLAADLAPVRERRNGGAPRQTSAAYDDGRWQMVVQRPLHPDEPEHVGQIRSDSYSAMGFVVWDGGNPDAHAVSPWIDLSVPSGDRPPSHQ
jgi:cytochrome c oxidase cbb3-type subunit 2